MVQGRSKDPSQLSRKPSQIRNRLRRKGKKFDEDLEMYLEVMGRKPIEQWDLEELARGRPRNKDGTFAGTAPKWLTISVQREAKRRLVEHTIGKLSGHVDSAVRAIAQLITSEEVDLNGKPIVDARTRLAAAIFVVENIVGKPKAVVELTAADDVKSAIAAAIVLDDGAPQDSSPVVLEGQFTEDDEEEDDDGI
jgi:hypothetical protein